MLKVEVAKKLPATLEVIAPIRYKTSAEFEPPAVVISHADWRKMYSLVIVDDAIWVEAELDAATVVDIATVVPTMPPFVNSTAAEPSTFGVCHIRVRRRPAWLLAIVTAIIEPEEYHVPAEKLPEVTFEVRQQSSAKWPPTLSGAPEGWVVAVKVVVVSFWL